MEQIIIGETTFYVRKFSAMEQIKIFGDLQKTILPSVSKLITGKENEEANNDGFSQALAELSKRLDGNELIKLAQTLIKPDTVTVQRDDLSNGEEFKLSHNKFDVVFTDMSDIIELLVFILRLNFESFFTKYLTRLGLGQSLAGKG